MARSHQTVDLCQCVHLLLCLPFRFSLSLFDICVCLCLFFLIFDLSNYDSIVFSFLALFLSFLKSFFAHFLHLWFLLPLPRSQIVHEPYGIFQFILFLDFEDSPVIQILDALNKLLVRAISHTNNFHFKDLLEKFLQRLKSYNLRWEKIHHFKEKMFTLKFVTKIFLCQNMRTCFKNKKKLEKNLNAFF